MSTPMNRCQLPFSFPFAPLGLGLFDTDPSRILGFLHHQTLLAEEALRYRGMFLNTKDAFRINPLTEMFIKEQERIVKTQNQFPPGRENSGYRYPIGIPDLLPASTSKFNHHFFNDDLLNKYNTDTPETISSDDSSIRNETPTNLSDSGHNKTDLRRGGSYMKESIRFNPLSVNITDKQKEQSAHSMSPALKALHDSMMRSASDKDIKCNLCNASFPSTWLLEQHTNLQHSNTRDSIADDKNFISEQFRSAFAKHGDHNNRARLPADKLFTCDVCGMQFRYLKSFKKHRLNHALERIHGKKSSENNELVSSSNESVEDCNLDLNGMIKDDDEDEDPGELINSIEYNSMGDEYHGNITSSDVEVTSQNDNASSSSCMGNEIGTIKVRSQSFLQKSEAEMSIPMSSNFSNLLHPDTTIGLNPHETSLLNFLRVEANEKQQRDRTNPVSRFACPFCGKCVRSKENLKLHVRKHTGERPFVCLFCGRAFGGKSDLTRHLRIHTGERPYHCEACGKCFARADYLSKHLTTHLHNPSR